MSTHVSRSTLPNAIGAPLRAAGSGWSEALSGNDDQTQEDEAPAEKQYLPIKNQETSQDSPQQPQRPRSHHSLARSYSDGTGFHRASIEEVDMAAGDTANPTDPEKQFEVRWDGENDPRNPRSMSNPRKWLVVLIVSMSSLCVTSTSSIYTSTYDQITQEFNCSEIVATLGLSLFVIGLGLGPMLLAPLSEFYGRRNIYIISFAFFVIWLIPCALARNIQTMLIARFLNGLSGSAFLSVAGGTVGDLFSRYELHAPMMIYTASPFLGPEVGPIFGGFINQYTTWRWTFYVLLIWSGVMLALIIIFVPETYHPVLLRDKARKLRRDTGNDRWKAPIEMTDRSIAQTLLTSIYRPFQLLTLEPMCLNLCLFSAVLLGVLYLFFGAFNLVFSSNHGFQLWQIGLSFSGLLAGLIFGIATDPLWHKNYVRLVNKRERLGGEPGGSEPEYRLPPAIAGAILVPIGLFWFGWTTTLLVFSGVFTFLVDAYPLYAASALAANSFARSSFAAAFPLFGIQMYNKLGYQWATTLLAALCVVLAPFPYLFFKYGKRIRGGSRYATAK
ncbi:MAG: hypothetical protein MMC33_000983 [Icmadophila ericetorum]|nr:hypothetical protein [Icmadophila ericetorum]